MPTLRITPMGLPPVEHALSVVPPELLEALSESTRSLPDQKLFKKQKAAPATAEDVPGAYCSYTFHLVFEEGAPTASGSKPWHLRLLKNVHPPGKPLRRAAAELPRIDALRDMRSAGWVLVELLDGSTVTASRKFFR